MAGVTFAGHPGLVHGCPLGRRPGAARDAGGNFGAGPGVEPVVMEPASATTRRCGRLLVGLAALGAAAACGSPPARTGTTVTSTGVAPPSTVAAPGSGRVTVSYGDAAVSVPASWDVTVDGCTGPGPGIVQLGSLTRAAFCPEESDVARVAILPLGTTPVPHVAGRLVHGIRVVEGANEGAPGLSVALVPSLKVEIQTSGTGAQAVLGTLSVSPRVVALAGGSVPAPPASWRRRTVDGLRLAVPSGWPVERVGGTCAVVGFGSPALVEEAPSEPVPSCPSTGSWVALDPDPFTDGVAVGPSHGSAAVDGPCLVVHGLKVCPLADPTPGVLEVSVASPGRPPSTFVTLGLGDGGTVARTVLRSLQPA